MDLIKRAKHLRYKLDADTRARERRRHRIRKWHTSPVRTGSDHAVRFGPCPSRKLASVSAAMPGGLTAPTEPRRCEADEASSSWVPAHAAVRFWERVRVDELAATHAVWTGETCEAHTASPQEDSAPVAGGHSLLSTDHAAPTSYAAVVRGRAAACGRSATRGEPHSKKGAGADTVFASGSITTKKPNRDHSSEEDVHDSDSDQEEKAATEVASSAHPPWETLRETDTHDAFCTHSFANHTLWWTEEREFSTQERSVNGLVEPGLTTEDATDETEDAYVVVRKECEAS